MVDDELEVGQGLAALVLRGVERGGGVVDGVDEAAPSRFEWLVAISIDGWKGDSTHSASSEDTQEVSSSRSLPITMIPSLGTSICVVL